MAPLFVVETTSRFDRLARSLTRRHPEFASLYREAVTILQDDPTNRSRRHAIVKLRGSREDHEYRLRLRRFRFLYDVDLPGATVTLTYCGLRREATYRR